MTFFEGILLFLSLKRGAYLCRSRLVFLQVEYEETLLAIQERDDAMRELEQGVLQVNEIFKDMAQLVHDQGDLIGMLRGGIITPLISGLAYKRKMKALLAK